MVKKGEHFIPDIVVIGDGKATNVIIKGMEFGRAISGFEYSARSDNGDLHPTVKLLELDIETFDPKDGSDTFMRLQRMFEKKAETAETESTGE